MTNTKRNRPTSREAHYARMEREWEKRVAQERQERERKEAQQGAAAQPDPMARQVQALTREAQAVFDTQLGGWGEAQRAAGRPFTRQNPPVDAGTGAEGLLWWTGGQIDDYIPLGEYGSRQRQHDLRTFALVAPMCLIAESVLIKKMQALQWSIESGRNRALHWRNVLADLEQGKGWDIFIARWVRAYCESDYGGYAEIIRSAPSWAVEADGQLTSRGETAVREGEDSVWTIVDARVMDPVQCVPMADPAFPLTYFNPHTGAKHRLRSHQFMLIQDMPNVDDTKPNQGLCAISRAVWAAREDQMATRYSFEAMSENPGAGMILGNINPNYLRTALDGAKAEREARGVVYYKGIIFLPVMDPSGTIKLEYLTFAHLPENFNRTEDYSRIKEIVASAFGMDVLELGSIPGHNLGTAQQASVAASKARGKGIGALIQGVERQFRRKFLPEDVQLRIKKHDIDEQKERAELDTFYFAHATESVTAGIWTAEMANQYLADKGAINPEMPYMWEDITPSEEVDDTEAPERVTSEGDVTPRREKRWEADGPRVRVTSDGTIEWVEAPYRQALKAQRKVKPEPGLMAALSAKVTEDDVQRSRRKFGEAFPYFAGLVGQA